MALPGAEQTIMTGGETRRAGRSATAAATFAVLTVIVTVASTLVAYQQRVRHDGASRLQADHLVVAAGDKYLGVVSRNVAQFDAATGIKVNLSVRYVDFGRAFPASYIQRVTGDGATPVLELMPYHVTFEAILAGRWDAYLHQFGADLAALHDRVWVSFAPEMNGPAYPWGYHHIAPGMYVAAWIHVQDMLEQGGASDVNWMWQIQHQYRQTEHPLSLLWPGSKRVDTVGIDGYYYFRGETFGSIFTASLRAVRRLTRRPILVSEAAIGPVMKRWGAGQASKMANLFEGVSRNGLEGLIWFDLPQFAPPYHQDWELVPNSPGLLAFRQQARAWLTGSDNT